MPAFTLSRDDDSAPFFDALADGRLLLRRDPTSGTWSGPAATDPGLEWAAASGTGHVESWAVVQGRDGAVVVGIVELDEGPWMRTRLLDVDVDAGALVDGLRVRVTPLHPDDPDGAGPDDADAGEPIPCFAPVC